MARNSGLGKGLAALIPSDLSEEDSSSGLRHIDIALVVPNRFQPRAHFNEETLANLADSIAKVGVIQPIVVRETDGGYEILAGERRWRAAQRAGLTQIPAVVRDSDDMSVLEVAIVENIQREDLNALEEAAAYRQLTDDFGLTQGQVAKKVGRSRSAIANSIRLLSLPAGVQRLIIDGRLTAGHGRALLKVKGDENRQTLAKKIVKDSLSVRDAEKIADSIESETSESETSEPAQNQPEESPETRAGILELEELLTARFGTKVTVQIARGVSSRGQGKIVIRFADLSDLERIYNVITPPHT